MRTTYTIPKILEVMSRIQRGRGDIKLDNYTLLKHIFFADRYHLRTYGSPLTGDNFFAMDNGPVPSYTKSLLKKDTAFLGAFSSDDIELFNANVKTFTGDHSWVTTRQDPYKKLSASEYEALSFSIDTFGKFDESQLILLTHDYPEWKKYKEFFEENEWKFKRQDMSFLDFFKNPKLGESESIKKFLREDPFYAPPDQMRVMKEYFLETYPA
jgi:uncharacterized phage-associated protein